MRTMAHHPTLSRRQLAIERWVRGPAGVFVASAVVACGLAAVVWLDFSATRRELLALLADQAASLRQVVAAAARSNREAARLSEAQITARLLDNARLLGELDRQGTLDQDLLDRIVEQNRLFRVSVYAPDGSIESASATEGRPRRPGGFGPGAGAGFRRGGEAGPRGGPGMGLAERLLSGQEAEASTEVHTSRGHGGSRLSAGVRRARGGAIVLNVDASSIASLQRQASLDLLLADMTRSAHDLAYVVLEGEGLSLAHGELPVASDDGSLAVPLDTGGADEHELSARHVELKDGQAIEYAGDVTLGDAAPARLRLGMRLDGVRRAESRLLARLALSLVAGLGLAGLGLGTVWLRRKYGLLSERHARAQEALRRRDRLAAMGELASTVAHEVRNPLNAVAMSAQRLRREFLGETQATDRAELEDLLGVVEGETRRIDRIVQQFLDFARAPRLAPRSVALGPLVTEVAESARSLAGTRGVAVEADVSGAGEAAVDPDQLRQALDNVVRNAVEATPEGGRVSILARSGPQGHILEVSDTGRGISPEDLPRIFDLYFTTRAEGTGVGLAVTQQVVAGHGGTIEVDSRPGEGTRMTIQLPLAAPESAGV